MTHAEFMAKISAITERGIAYANAHASEIKAKAEKAAAESEEKINDILASAQHAQKKIYSVYESFKAAIGNTAVNAAQYEDAVRKLADILGL